MTTFARTALFNEAVSHYTTTTGWWGGKNWTEAFRLFERLVQDNSLDELHGEALCYLGDMCRIGKYKINKDEYAAAVFYTRAIRADNGRAMVALGDMYAGRLGGLIGGPPQAESLYLYAQAHDIPEAQARLESLRAGVAARDEFAAVRNMVSMAISGMGMIKTLTNTHDARIAALEETVAKLEETVAKLEETVAKLEQVTSRARKTRNRTKV